jgi:hypothetical protein
MENSKTSKKNKIKIFCRLKFLIIKNGQGEFKVNAIFYYYFSVDC